MFRLLKSKLDRLFSCRLQCSSITFLAIYTAFTFFVYNSLFWQKVVSNFSFHSFADLTLFATIALFVFGMFLGFFALFSSKYLSKFFFIFFLLSNTAAFYFMSSYGITIDKGMIINTLQTDAHEAKDLLSLRLVFYLFFLGLLPAFIVFRAKITYKNFTRELLQKLAVISIYALVLLTFIALQYREAATLVRENKPITTYLVPNNYISAITKVAKQHFQKERKFILIGKDASLEQKKTKTLVILVVGETARQNNFSLYGYDRKTNPLLEKDNTVPLPNATSCGTATAVSLPCIFSHLGRKDFVHNNENLEALPSFLSRLGIGVLWRGNNSGGCKEQCNGVPSELVQNNEDKRFCGADGCVDEILLDGLNAFIKKSKSNTFVVLHQNGSHGPRYNHRYPKEFEIFKPVCNKAEVNKCSKEELVNAYDNTIVYTDYFLHNLIETIKKDAKMPTVLIYASDHGESLGEYGIYLHGFPYDIAPKEQKTIPFLVFMSDSFKKEYKINNACLGKNANYSHDNIFHSVLGLFSVKTKIYDKNLDIFSNCIKR